MMVVGSSSFESYREGVGGWGCDEGCWLLHGAGGLSHGGPRFPRTALIGEESYGTFSHQSEPCTGFIHRHSQPAELILK